MKRPVDHASASIKRKESSFLWRRPLFATELRVLRASRFVGFAFCKNRDEMNRATLLTLGISITVAAAALIVFLVFFAEQLYGRALLAAVIFFQLSFIWTCAELLDTPDEIMPPDD